ncbi:MAG: hypothetical protein AAGF31_01345 [Planctomycetota bacterium]
MRDRSHKLASRPNVILLTAGLGLGLAGSLAIGQSGAGRYSPPGGSGSADRPQTPPAGFGFQGSGARIEGELALRGYCPVCLLDDNEWVAGDPNFTAVFDGKAYRFPDARRMQIFRARPVKYAPALGGDNPVRFVQTGQRLPGDLASGIRHGGRLYFVGSPQQQQTFKQSPTRFAMADLALGGDCVVSLVDRNQRIAGVADLTVVYNGMRYQFIGLQQQQAFLAQPNRYLPTAVQAGAAQGGAVQNERGPANAPPPVDAGSGGRESLRGWQPAPGSGSGRSSGPPAGGSGGR